MNIQSLLKEIHENRKNVRLIGVDKETGGINCHRNRHNPDIPVGQTGADFYPILQFAAIIYDGYLNQLSDEINVIIYHSKEHLDTHVSDWSKEQFKNTLMIQCPESKMSLEDAEQFIISHFKDHGITDNQSAFMLGNSIRLDMEFLVAQMPALEDYFHYRLIDVSVFKVVFGFIFGKAANFKKECSHDALADIRESVAELKFYLDNFVLTAESFYRNNTMTTECHGILEETKNI